MNNIAVFASGSGTNCENLIRHFQKSDQIQVAAVITNNPFAGVIERATNLDVDCFINLFQTEVDFQLIYNLLEDYHISWIVLAGFLKLVPPELLRRFPQRVVNLHPALLPDFGGKGMYGHHVHRAVLDSGKKVSGISIHYVNEHFDKGKIISQFTCPVLPEDSQESLAQRIHELEYRHFPAEIEKLIMSNQ